MITKFGKIFATVCGVKISFKTTATIILSA